MNDDDPVSAPVLAQRPRHLTYGELKRLFDFDERFLAGAEGTVWVRGHVDADSPVWRALLVARVLR